MVLLRGKDARPVSVFPLHLAHVRAVAGLPNTPLETMSRSLFILEVSRLSREIPSTNSDGLINNRGLETAVGEVTRVQAFTSKPCVDEGGDKEQKHRKTVSAVKGQP